MEVGFGRANRAGRRLGTVMASRAAHADVAGRLPDFIAVGPNRTGTTWMHTALKGHVNLPAGPEESQFFRSQFFRARYHKGLDWYRNLFANGDPALPAGEVCPSYFASAEARERIARDIPNCRIVCSLRDPVERLYEHYMGVRRGYGARLGGFEETLKVRPEFLDSCRYAFHVSAWQEKFGQRNVMVAIYDDLCNDAQAYLDAICDFIGIARYSLLDSAVGNGRVNVITTAPRNPHLADAAGRAVEWLCERGHYSLVNRWHRTRLWDLCFAGGEPYPELAPDLDARLRDLLRPEVEALESLAGRDLAAWKAPRGKARDEAPDGRRQAG